MLPELEKLVKEKKPAVLIDRYYQQLDSSYVTIDNVNGSLEAVNYLAKKGYRRIALVTNLTDQLQMIQRMEGYQQGLNQNHLQLDQQIIKKIPFGLTDEKVVKEIKDFVELNENKMDAIFFTSNNLGVAGLEALRSIEKRIPDDISVICFDDNDLFRLGMPGISVVSQPIKDIAKKAVEILIQQINQRSTTVEHIELKTVMIERESVK
jgi:LacI family transcriptional regulator